MELLRLIYWSLIGFGILTLLVILISYATYQIRKKLRKTPSESIRNEDRTKKIKVNISNRNLSRVQHHPRVVRRKYHADDLNAPRQKRKERITILNDLLKEDVLNYNRFRNN